MSQPAPTAAGLGLIVCRSCALVLRPRSPQAACPRCRAAVHLRQPYSILRSWVLLICAAILYVPANTLPMMHTNSLFGAQSDTILSGVVYFWQSGSWYLALIIFLASIMLPLLKMLALAWLLITVQLRSRWQPDRRARVYRMMALVGRWSMLDIYVVAIVVTLVQAGLVASAEPGDGAIAFGAVVVLTMLAVMSFDPRMIWDAVRD